MESNYISVIIPVYNAEKFLDSLLNSINKQTLDANKYEVIFVDNNSSDSSAEIIKDCINENKNKNYNYFFFADKQGSYATRNFGIKKAKGNILAFTDADCILKQNWLENIYDYYTRNNKNKIIAGNIEMFIKDQESLWANFDKIVYLNNERYAKNNTGATANLVVPSKIFNDIGKFSEVYSGGDSEWTRKATENGYEIIYREDVKVFHPSRNSFKKIKEKMYRIGYGKGKKAITKNKSKTNILFLYFLRIFYIITNISYSKKLFNKVGFLKVILFNLCFFILRVIQLKGVNDGYNDKINQLEGN